MKMTMMMMATMMMTTKKMTTMKYKNTVLAIMKMMNTIWTTENTQFKMINLGVLKLQKLIHPKRSNLHHALIKKSGVDLPIAVWKM